MYAHVRTGETNLGDLIADAMRAESGAQIALINCGAIRDSIPAGDITKGNIINVLPFENYIVTKKNNGSNLSATLESAVKALPEENGAFYRSANDNPAKVLVSSTSASFKPSTIEPTYCKRSSSSMSISIASCSRSS